MKRLIAGLVLMTMCFANHEAAAEEALVWRFNDPDIMGRGFQKVKAAEVVGPNGETINAIRMKAVDGDVTSYLQLYAGDGAEFISLGDTLAMPSEDGWVLEPLFAGLGEGYARDGVQFMIELGAYGKGGDWTALAYSTLADYSELVSEHILQMTTTAVPTLAWDGGVFSVPEPTGATLLLWGVALLCLRRKRQA